METPYPLVIEIKSKPTLIVPNQLFGIYIFLVGDGCVPLMTNMQKKALSVIFHFFLSIQILQLLSNVNEENFGVACHPQMNNF